MAETEKDDDVVKRSDLEGFLATFTAKHGGSERRALEVLADETLVLRRKNQRYRERAEAAEANAPAEGARVLTPDEAKRYDAFEALKLAPEVVTATVEERDTLKAKDAARTRRDAVHDAAGSEYRPDVLFDLVESKGLHLEVREQDAVVNGKTVTRKTVMVRPAADERAELKPLEDYDPIKPYLPALRADAVSERRGTEYPAQRPTGRAPVAPSIDEIAQDKAATGAYSI